MKLFYITEVTVRPDVFCEYKPVTSWSLDTILVVKKTHSLAHSILPNHSNYFSYRRITSSSLQWNRNYLSFMF